MQHGFEAIIVRVMPHQTAIRLPDQNIYCVQCFRFGRKGAAVGHHILFVGHGHIQACKISVQQKLGQFLRRFFIEIIGIVPQMPMDLGRIAVPQLFSKQTALHYTTSL